MKALLWLALAHLGRPAPLTERDSLQCQCEEGIHLAEPGVVVVLPDWEDDAFFCEQVCEIARDGVDGAKRRSKRDASVNVLDEPDSSAVASSVIPIIPEPPPLANSYKLQGPGGLDTVDLQFTDVGVETLGSELKNPPVFPHPVDPPYALPVPVLNVVQRAGSVPRNGIIDVVQASDSSIPVGDQIASPKLGRIVPPLPGPPTPYNSRIPVPYNPSRRTLTGAANDWNVVFPPNYPANPLLPSGRLPPPPPLVPRTQGLRARPPVPAPRLSVLPDLPIPLSRPQPLPARVSPFIPPPPLPRIAPQPPPRPLPRLLPPPPPRQIPFALPPPPPPRPLPPPPRPIPFALPPPPPPPRPVPFPLPLPPPPPSRQVILRETQVNVPVPIPVPVRPRRHSALLRGRPGFEHEFAYHCTEVCAGNLARAPNCQISCNKAGRGYKAVEAVPVIPVPAVVGPAPIVPRVAPIVPRLAALIPPLPRRNAIHHLLPRPPILPPHPLPHPLLSPHPLIGPRPLLSPLPIPQGPVLPPPPPIIARPFLPPRPPIRGPLLPRPFIGPAPPLPGPALPLPALIGPLRRHPFPFPGPLAGPLPGPLGGPPPGPLPGPLAGLLARPLPRPFGGPLSGPIVGPLPRTFPGPLPGPLGGPLPRRLRRPFPGPLFGGPLPLPGPVLRRRLGPHLHPGGAFARHGPLGAVAIPPQLLLPSPLRVAAAVAETANLGLSDGPLFLERLPPPRGFIANGDVRLHPFARPPIPVKRNI